MNIPAILASLAAAALLGIALMFSGQSSLTAGMLNPAVTQASIETTICKGGWASSVRPPASYTTALKKKQIKAYGYGDTKLSDYQEDHVISLEQGGSPVNPVNLWPEPIAVAKQDDVVENQINTDICSGKITLLQGQTQELQLKVSRGYKQGVSAQ